MKRDALLLVNLRLLVSFDDHVTILCYDRGRWVHPRTY